MSEFYELTSLACPMLGTSEVAKAARDWVVAPDASVFAYDASGRPAFHGTLYRTRGSPLGAPFEPSRSQVTAGTRPCRRPARMRDGNGRSRLEGPEGLTPTAQPREAML